MCGQFIFFLSVSFCVIRSGGVNHIPKKEKKNKETRKTPTARQWTNECTCFTVNHSTFWMWWIFALGNQLIGRKQCRKLLIRPIQSTLSSVSFYVFFFILKICQFNHVYYAFINIFECILWRGGVGEVDISKQNFNEK